MSNTDKVFLDNLISFNKIPIGNNIPSTVIDGKDIINLYSDKTELAKKLNPYIQEKKPIKFLSWNIFSISRFMLFLSKEDYPVQNFTKPFYKNGKKYKDRKLDDYWGIVVSCLIAKVKRDPELHNLLINNKLDFNAYDNEQKETTFLGTSLNVKTKISRLHNYCKAVVYVSCICKLGIINDDNAVKYLLNRDFPNLIKSLEEITKNS